MTRGVRIGVLALQGDVREHLHALGQLGAQASTVRRPEELEAVQALVIPGGESTTMDKLARAFGLRDPLRARLEAGMPAYGSCAGMIMLADRLADARPDQETLGGLDILVRRNAFGRQVDSFEEDLRMPSVRDGAERPVRAVFIRAPWVEEHGPGVQVLGWVGDGDACHPVAVRQGALLATSFHPEMTGDVRVHELFVQIVRDTFA